MRQSVGRTTEWSNRNRGMAAVTMIILTIIRTRVMITNTSTSTNMNMSMNTRLTEIIQKTATTVATTTTGKIDKVYANVTASLFDLHL